MNTPTNIIYKAKSNNGLWYKGYYVRTDNGHIIIEPGADIDDEDNIHYINPNTLCIGCVIDGKEYFAGDTVAWTAYAGVITFSEDGFRVKFVLPNLVSRKEAIMLLSDCAEYLTITGNIHD